MSRTLTEQKVLKKLGIPDFRHMTKDKVMKFASMLHKMDREVAIKALEQFPEFANATTEIVAYFKEIVAKGFEENSASQNAFYSMCESINETLKQELKDGELSFDERMVIIDKMMELAKLEAEKDSENKSFIRWMVGVGGIVGSLGILYLANALGGQTNVEADSLDNSICNEDIDVVDYQ